MKNIFNPADAEEFILRINKLTPATQPLWGKMSVDQMLAHCNVTYEMIYEDKHAKPNAFMRVILKMLVKKKVVSEAPYKHSNPTAPAFKITGSKNFEEEKSRLINYIRRTQQSGADFEGKESHSFGRLTTTEWNNLMSKHLDHHLTQFGVQ
ncbi:MAG: DUF1569 domain-containing protein [Chitinophagales bacterium]|nr:DUF1569 domain-containing protein [Chitinophagales bacterium]